MYTILSESEAEAIHSFQNIKRNDTCGHTHADFEVTPYTPSHIFYQPRDFSHSSERHLLRRACLGGLWTRQSLILGGGEMGQFFLLFFLAGPKTQFCSATEATHLHKPPLVVNGYAIQKQMKMITGALQ